MKNWKNHVKLLLCVCAMSGLAACGSSDSSSSSNLSKSNQDTLSIGIDGVLYSETETEDSSIEISNVENSIYTISGGSNEGELTTTSSNRDILISTIESDSLVLMPIGDNPIDEVDITITRAGDANYNSISITLSFKLKNSQTPLTLSLDGNLVPDYTEIMILTTDANLTYAIDGDSGSGACSVVEGDTDAIESTINDDCTQLTINPHTIGTETITLKKAGNNTYLEAILDITFIVGVTVKQNQVIYLGANANTYTDGTIIKDYSETTPTFTEPFNGENVVSEVTFTQQYSDSDTDDDVVQVNPNEDNSEVTFTIVGAGTETLTITKAGTDDFNEIEVIYTITIAQISQEPITLAEATFPEGVSIDDENKLTGLVYNSNGTDTDSHATLTLNGGSSPEPFQISVDDEDVGVSTTFLNTTLTLIPDDGATITPEEFMITKNGDRNYLDTSITLQVSVLKASPVLTIAGDNLEDEVTFTATSDIKGNLEGLIYKGTAATLNLSVGEETTGFSIDEGVTSDGAEATIADGVLTIDPSQGAIGNDSEIPEAFIITRMESDNYEAITSYTLNVSVLKITPVLTVAGDNLEAEFTFTATSDIKGKLTGLIYDGEEAILDLMGDIDAPFTVGGGTDNAGAIAALSMDKDTITITPSSGASTVDETFMITNAGDENYNATAGYSLTIPEIAKADQDAITLPSEYADGDDYKISFSSHGIPSLDILVNGGDGGGALTPMGHDTSNLMISSSDNILQLEALAFSGTEIVMISKAADTNYNQSNTLTLTVNFSSDVDSDSNGLIDIWNLEQLSNVRFDLDGSHYNDNNQSATNAGCPDIDLDEDPITPEVATCHGYELKQDLDFHENTSYKGTIVDHDDNSIPNTENVAATKLVWTPQLNGSQVDPANASNAGWNPIGSSSSSFTGTFEGNNFVIKNLYMKDSDANNLGLFVKIDEGTEIQNLSLDLVYVSGTNLTAGLVSEVSTANSGGSIDNCHITGNSIIEGTSNGATAVRVGGITAHNGTKISNSSSSAQITGNYTGSGNIEVYSGSLVGQQKGSGDISHSHATGSVTSTSTYRSYSGGLLGYLDNGGSISYSYATGAVSSNSVNRSYSGGLVAFQDAFNNSGSIISNSYASGAVYSSSSSQHAYSGGLVAYQNTGTSIVSYSYATGSVSSYAPSSGGTKRAISGGLVGIQSGGNISYSYATGVVSSSALIYSYSGGLVAWLSGTDSMISHSYATGSVSSSSSSVSYSGGLVGLQTAANSMINYSYATGASLDSDSNSYSGGLVARQTVGSISHSYATGSVGNALYTGSLVGEKSGTVTFSCGSGGSKDLAEEGSQLIDHLRSEELGDGATSTTKDDSWECYDHGDSFFLFTEWGKYFYDNSDSNNVAFTDDADKTFVSGEDTRVWNFDGTAFLPTLVAKPADTSSVIEQQLQYAHQHVGQWQLLDDTSIVHPFYEEDLNDQSFTLPNAEGPVLSFSVSNYSITVNWDTITGDVAADDTGTYDFTDPEEDTNGSLQYNPDAAGDTLTVNEPSSGTQSVFLRGIITIMDDNGTDSDTTDDRTWIYNQDFPFRVTK